MLGYFLAGNSNFLESPPPAAVARQLTRCCEPAGDFAPSVHKCVELEPLTGLQKKFYI